jgi:hypothetical protein
MQAKRILRAIALAVPTLLAALPLRAYAMSGPLVDTIADFAAVIVMVVVPVGAIYLFWKVHVLPEVIAEKRHHPQKEAIKTLCILSLFFGGLLWPVAWLWAYTKPTLHKLAYGTDKHEDYYKELPPETAAPAEELARLRADVERLTDSGVESDDLKALRRELRRLESKFATPDKNEAN